MSGNRLLAFLFISGLVLPMAAQANEVTDAGYTSSEGEVTFTLTTSESAPEPNVFSTEQPPRIVIELPGTSSALPADRVPVGVGAAQSFSTISAGGRTRMVIDLSTMASYDYEVEGNEVRLTVAGDTTRPAQRPAAVGRPVATGDTHSIDGIDFRRGPDGESRVIVDFDRAGTNVSINERGSRLLVDLFNTELPDEWRQRLDVTDFATPVQEILPEQRGNNVRLTLQVAGAFEHLSFQRDNRLELQISEPEAAADPVRDRELQLFEEREFTGDNITLNFQDIPVRSVLQLIADVSDLNIVVSDTVSGNVTLRLTNVPWDQALDIVLETKNLDMRRSGNVIWIAQAAEIREREQQLLQAQQDRQTLEPLRTAMLSISYANAREMAELIRAASVAEGEQGMLSNRGTVTVDNRTNTLLVTDTVDRIDDVRDLVTELDRPVRQVLIESRIVVARHDFTYDLGVRFGVTGAREDSRGNVISTARNIEGTDTYSQRGVTNRRDPTSAGFNLPNINDRMNVNLPISDPAGSIGWSILAADYLLDLELSALESEGEGEVISTPRVITANQQEAFIQQGVEIPFESTQGGTAGAVNVEFKEAVLELRATPMITPDNRVQLTLNVKQDTVGEIFETGRGGSVPSIDTRELGTSVLIENGQTVVLGGIFQEERQHTTTKVPMLGDVPVIGNLFRRRSTEEDKRELLIFITPTILDDRVELD